MEPSDRRAILEELAVRPDLFDNIGGDLEVVDADRPFGADQEEIDHAQ